MEYAIKQISTNHWYQPVRWRHSWTPYPEKAERWKTKKGADARLEKLISAILKSHEKWLQIHDFPEEHIRADYAVVEIVPAPPKKFPKKQLKGKTRVEFEQEIVRVLKANGWKPNIKYSQGINEDGFNKWGRGYLIDADDRFAITLKSSVLTVHDGTRQFCKVISMAYNEIEIKDHELVCGRIALKL